MSAGRRQIGEHLADALATRRALVQLVSAGRRVEEAYNRALSPFDITLDQCRTLDVLRHAGSRGLDSGAFHNALREVGASSEHEARLENEGWLLRDHEGHRSITSQGRRLIADLEPVLETVEDRLAEELGIEEIAELVRIVGKVVD